MAGCVEDNHAPDDVCDTVDMPVIRTKDLLRASRMFLSAAYLCDAKKKNYLDDIPLKWYGWLV